MCGHIWCIVYMCGYIWYIYGICVWVGVYVLFHMYAYIRPIYGLYTAYIRPLYGLYTAFIWPIHGLYTAFCPVLLLHGAGMYIYVL